MRKDASSLHHEGTFAIVGVIDDAVQTVRSESAVIGRLNGFAREVILKGVSVIKKAPTPYGVRRESGAIPMRDRTLSLD